MSFFSEILLRFFRAIIFMPYLISIKSDHFKLLRIINEIFFKNTLKNPPKKTLKKSPKKNDKLPKYNLSVF